MVHRHPTPRGNLARRRSAGECQRRGQRKCPSNRQAAHAGGGRSRHRPIRESTRLSRIDPGHLGHHRRGTDRPLAGNWKGRSFIQGGRHRVRRLLFMPALVAVQHNPDLKRKYEALLANGKPPQGRPDGRDAEAPRPRQRPDAAGPQLDGPSAARVLLPGLPAPSPAGSVHG
ncbi:MAG: IS110 family transposase [Gemmatimonadetes bacterium]|nr:IS110 family transposase [Gemmatimonadota bacterium]